MGLENVHAILMDPTLLQSACNVGNVGLFYMHKSFFNLHHNINNIDIVNPQHNNFPLEFEFEVVVSRTSFMQFTMFTEYTWYTHNDNNHCERIHRSNYPYISS